MLHKIFIMGALVMIACAGTGTAQMSDPATDPANPQATVAPVALGYRFVQAPSPISPNIKSPKEDAGDPAGRPHSDHDMPGRPQGAHDISGMPQGGHGTMPETRATPPTDKSRPPATTGPTATQYTCTMHPEIRIEMPGPCPSCGMKLVPVEPRQDGGRR